MVSVTKLTEEHFADPLAKPEATLRRRAFELDELRLSHLGANWRCLRTSHAVWLKLAGADVKDAQGQMRHSRASTTLDIYQQFVPESQQRVVAKLSSLSRMVN